MNLSPAWRKLVLLVHITSSVGFAGAVAGFLALAFTGAATVQPLLAQGVYLAMQILTWAVIVPLAVTSVLVGLVQSLGTPWGLFRYYWVIVKLVLTLVALAVLLMQTQTVDRLAGAALAGDLGTMTAARFSMVLHGAGGLAVLVVANVLSIYKPRGMTPYGASRIA